MEQRDAADAKVTAAIAAAREAGHSWSAIGVMLGVSGEAVRQRYGTDEIAPVQRRRRH